MTKRKTIVGICLLCAVATSAMAAQSALAHKGTTQFTCANTPGTGTFKTEHCKPGEGGSEFSDVAVGQGVTTELSGSNAKTNTGTNGPEPTILKSVTAGLEAEVKATEVTGTGSATNQIDEFVEGTETHKEHYVVGTGTITYKGAELVKPQPTKCKLEKVEYTTNELSATTTGQGDGLKFAPATGEVFIEFNVVSNPPETCPGAVLGNYKVTGTVVGTPEGATTVFTHAGTTGQGTLKFRGQNAGVNGKLTISGRAKGSGGEYTPLTATTVETTP